MSRLSRLTAKANNILNGLTQKKSYPSHNATEARTGNHYERYLRLSERNIKNLSYKEYQDIMKDTQVKVGLEILKYFLISKNYVLTSASDDPIDVEATDFIQECFDNMETPFRDVIKDILTAVRYGYSVHEKVYTINQDNKIGIKGLYPLHIRTLQNTPFVFDDKGELIAIHQESNYGSVDLPINKCLLYSFDKEFDEIEGNSILNELKPVVDDKEDVKDWLMTYANKNENPVMYGKTRDNHHASIMQSAFDNVAAGATSMIIGPEDEVGVLESNHRGETFFKILQYNDNQIFRRMFIGNLLLGDTSQTGSYAQIYGQQDFMLYIMDGILTDVAQCIHRGLINELVSMNFGTSANPPGFSFEKFSKKDVIRLLEIVKGFIDNGSLDSDNQGFKELLATAFMTEADIKLDLETIEDNTQTIEDETNYGYQPPLPGQTEAETIIQQNLKGII